MNFHIIFKENVYLREIMYRYRESLFSAAVLTVLLMFAASERSSAQGIGIGGAFSVRGVGVDVNMERPDDTGFNKISLIVDMTDVIVGNASYPGFLASYTPNFTVFGSKAWNGYGYDIYAGPGICAGIARNDKRRMGPTLGLNADVGCRLFLRRSIVIGIEFRADVGIHYHEGKMRVYQYGYERSYLPWVTICRQF